MGAPEDPGSGCPIRRGLVDNWEKMEKLWEYTFNHELRVNPEALGFPVLLTDCPLNSKSNREKMAQIMFEVFKVPGFYIATQAVLSLFAAGRTRGVVVESGHGVTHAVPVFEGYALPHAILRLDVGGDDVNECLRRSLALRGYQFGSSQLDLVRDIKEKLCYVKSASDSGGGDLQDSSALGDAGSGGDGREAYELPDGNVVYVDRECRTDCAEVLFQPSLLGGQHLSSESLGVGEMAAAAVAKCDGDLQQDLISAVVLAGGSSMLPGFSDRVSSSISKLQHLGSRVRVIPDPQNPVSGYNSQRRHAAWIGGSMLASLPTFAQIQVTKQEWEDSHDSIIHRKCF